MTPQERKTHNRKRVVDISRTVQEQFPESKGHLIFFFNEDGSFNSYSEMSAMQRAFVGVIMSDWAAHPYRSNVVQSDNGDIASTVLVREEGIEP